MNILVFCGFGRDLLPFKTSRQSVELPRQAWVFSTAPKGDWVQEIAMAVRMKDIADLVGVSVVTVSRALCNRPDIAPETKAKVLDCAERMNYRPNLMARSLVTGRSSLIGLVVPDLIHPFFTEIARELSVALRKNNYFLIVTSSESDPGLEQDQIEQMLAHHVDCLVVASCQQDSGSLYKIGQAGVPLVLIDRSFQQFSNNFVGVDDYRIGELATEHLIAQGYKCIAHIRGPATNCGDRRVEGYRDAIRRRGLPLRESYVIACGGESDSDGEIRGGQAMAEILTMRSRPDAIFCFNDSIAVGAMVKAFESGLRIPEDIAIVGCGNFHYSSKLRVPLSSIDQRAKEIGDRAAKMITALLKKPCPRRPRIEVLEPELVVRASSHSKRAFIDIPAGRG
jgi:LacI family transcriptional regulator